MSTLKNKVTEKIKNPEIQNFMLNDLNQNITPVNAVASQGTLTVDTQPIIGDTFTIGTTVYTFVADGTAAAEGEIDVGADLADAKTLIVAAINGTDHNTAHAQVTAAAFVGNDCVITASTKGVAGDSIITTETFDEATNVFDDTTLGTTTAGVNGTLGTKSQQCFDSSYRYHCIDDNGISDANWRRISLGSAY